MAKQQITMKELNDCITEFVVEEANYNTVQHRFEREYIENLLRKQDKNGNLQKGCLLAVIEEEGCGNPVIPYNTYETCTKIMVQRAVKDKDRALEALGVFTAFLNRECGIRFQVDSSIQLFNSRFERVLYLAKYLQENPLDLQALADDLCVSTKTLREDLKMLRDSGISFFDRKIQLPDMEYRNGTTTEMVSTMHPFLLTANLSEIIVMLQGLYMMSRKPESKAYAMKSAADIWSQLTPYARGRVKFVLSNMMQADISWLDDLDNTDAHAFQTELELSEQGENWELYVMKNNMKCYAVYHSGNKVKMLKKVRFRGWTDTGDYRFKEVKNKEEPDIVIPKADLIAITLDEMQAWQRCNL